MPLSQGIAQERLLFEGPNEYPVWAHGYAGLARLEKRRLQLMHQRLPQAGSVVSNLGVGWPGNTGPDTPPVWDWFAPVAATMGNRDYLGAHEYCGLNGIMENWGWWMGRILKCPYKVPMLITEYGPPDGGVYGASHAKQGWRNYPDMASEDAKAERCIEEMYRYAAVIGVDGRVRELCQYTYDGHGEDWCNFDIRTETFLPPIPGALAGGRVAASRQRTDHHAARRAAHSADPADTGRSAQHRLECAVSARWRGLSARRRLCQVCAGARVGRAADERMALRRLRMSGFQRADSVLRRGRWGNIKRLPW